VPETHDAPQLDLHAGPVRLFVHSIFVHYQHWPEPQRAGRSAPIFQRGAETFEDEEPWRIGHGVAIRLPLTRFGFVLGYWELPDPSRSESALWEREGTATFLVPGVNAEQVKNWPRPGESPDLAGTAMQDTAGVVSWVEDEEGLEVGVDPNVIELEDGMVVRVIPWA
jgi:hypothetical protein